MSVREGVGGRTCTVSVREGLRWENITVLVNEGGPGWEKMYSGGMGKLDISVKEL